MKPKNHRSDYFFSFFLSLKESPTFRPLILVAFSQNFRFCFFPFFYRCDRKKKCKIERSGVKIFRFVSHRALDALPAATYFLGGCSKTSQVRGREAGSEPFDSLHWPKVGACGNSVETIESFTFAPTIHFFYTNYRKQHLPTRGKNACGNLISYKHTKQ